MAANTGRLAGRTIFVSGGSRGIGLGIALKCARDGANIVLAAKTATAHPKLPGTIYTAAEEVEAAGGKCLPCIVDIQHEDQVQKAVDEAVSKFGGIDVLINNASAIHLTSTEATPMKRYDLMHHINTRGTFLCSKICAPHLRKGTNPHIMNLSPPLNLNPKWFKNHVAYTMAKYGMSMCVLGMSEEFKSDGIAVNALWPQTAIYTAAMSMLGGGEAIRETCRKPEIMSDAAYVMLCRDSRSYTGNFAIDEAVLREEGMTEFDHYAYDPSATLLPDFFLDVEDMDSEKITEKMSKGGADPAFKMAASQGVNVEETFGQISSAISPEIISTIGGVFAFDLKDAGIWYVDLSTEGGDVGMGTPPSGCANCTMTLSAEDFHKMFTGALNPTQAFMGGKLKIKGDLSMAMKLETLMKKMIKAKL